MYGVDGIAPESYANPAAFMACTKGCKKRWHTKAYKEQKQLTLSICSPICAGLSVTITPAFRRASTFADAVPARGHKRPDQRRNTSFTFAARDDSTCVAHAPARGSSTARNEANDRLGVGTRLVVLLQVLGRVLLHRATNLANDHDTCKRR